MKILQDEFCVAVSKASIAFILPNLFESEFAEQAPTYLIIFAAQNKGR